MASDNITRHDMLLDDQRIETENKSPGKNNDLVKKIKVKINGSQAEMMVGENSLRRALGMPSHDLLNGGIFHGNAGN